MLSQAISAYFVYWTGKQKSSQKLFRAFYQLKECLYKHLVLQFTLKFIKLQKINSSLCKRKLSKSEGGYPTFALICLIFCGQSFWSWDGPLDHHLGPQKCIWTTNTCDRYKNAATTVLRNLFQVNNFERKKVSWDGPLDHHLGLQKSRES